MKTRSPLLAVLGAAAVTLLTLSAAMDFWRTTVDYNEKSPDPYRLNLQEPRFRAVAAETPEDAVLGYASDLDFAQLTGSTAFFGAQYVLTPRVLVPYDSEFANDLVLANFTDPALIATFAAEHGMTTVKDFGHGIALLRKRGGE